MALGNLDIARWREKFPNKQSNELSLAFVGTPCEIESVRVLQDSEWDYQSQNAGVRAIGTLQGWNKKVALESLERPFDPDALRFIEYTDQYATKSTPRRRPLIGWASILHLKDTNKYLNFY